MINRIPTLFTVMFFLFSLALVIFVLSKSNPVVYESDNYIKHRVILVVLDSFRHDYLEIIKANKLELPNIQKMMNEGSRVMKMTPSFPSVTMPNHQTLVTGLYIPYHGITYNNFNDSSFNYDQFSMDNQSSLNEDRWYKGYPDPIWVTCERMPNCKSGSMLWPNTDAVINGYRPSKKVDQYSVLNYKMSIVYPYDRRVDELLGWVKNDLIDFGMIYFDEPDMMSHEFGPTHIKTLNKVVEMDGWIGRLFDGVKKAGLKNKIDIILTADHGMTELSRDRVINIDDFVPPDLYVSTYNYPVGIIYPNKGKEQEVYTLYKNASSHIQVYWRADVPEKFYYKENAHRISPIVTIVDLGWIVNSTKKRAGYYKGNHGYSQYEDDMKASFLALGPSFKNTIVDSVKNVDVYPLIMHLLGLKANANNGSFSRISPLLKESALTFIPRENRWSYDKYLILIKFILFIQLITCIVYFIYLLFMNFSSRQLDNRKDDIIHYDPEQGETFATAH